MSISLPLFRLQQIDTRLKQVNSRLAIINSILESNAELKEAAARLQDARSAQLQAENLLKNAEFESKNLRIKLETTESSLYSGRIHNPKELQDLQKEIEAINRNLILLENDQLERMISLDSANQTASEAQKSFEVIQGKVAGENASLRSEHITLQKEFDNLNNQRSAILPVLDQYSLGLYNALRQKYSGLAVSNVTENTCDACGSSLTPGLAQSVRNSNKLILCPMCGRILYSD